MKRSISLFILALLVFGTAFKTKTKPFEGTIKYTIDYHADYGVTKYPQEMTVSIKGDVLRVDMSLPFAEMSDIFDCKKKTHVKLCTVDGVKYFVRSDVKNTAPPEKVMMAKDSTKTIKELVCSFGRINEKEIQYVVYATNKYAISKSITDSGAQLPYHLFFAQKEFSGKLIMQQDLFDADGQTTYLVESIEETPLKDLAVDPTASGYNEVTQEGLGKIIENYFKGMH
jgi:hypothetical protein